MFVRLEQPRRKRFPWVTLLLVVLCVAAYVLLGLFSGTEREALVTEWGLVPARLLHDGWRGPEGWRLLTALFVHANWLHVVGNMLFLVIFGVPAERVTGHGLYALLFLGGGTVANLTGALTVAEADIAMVGCSGAVSVIMGTYLALFPRADLGIVLPLGLYFEFVRVPALLLIGLWVLLQLLFTWVGPSFGAVVWWTHIAGFVIGLLAAILLRPVLARRQRHGR